MDERERDPFEGTYYVNDNPRNLVFVERRGLELVRPIYHVYSPYECGAWVGIGFFNSEIYVGVYQQLRDHLDGVLGYHIGHVHDFGLFILGSNISAVFGGFTVKWYGPQELKKKGE